jgi:hypothetical protein
MRAPIDVALIPKSTMARNHKDHLNETIKQLQVTRTFAAENMQKAQEKYNNQHDQKAVKPSFLPGDKVMLFRSKTPKGQSTKLVKRWIGPFTLTTLGPPNTFKLRRDKDNMLLKTMVIIGRLKIFNSK